MPSIISHIAVPLALTAIAGKKTISMPLFLAGLLAAIVPDADVIAFKLGIAYAHEWGHRGITHSLFFAGILGLLAAIFASTLRSTRALAFSFIATCAASHGLLDMLTNGGLGVALWWPVSHERLFFPWQVIQVSPIGVKNFLSERGVRVLTSEFVWIWLPALGSVVFAWGMKRLMKKQN